MTAHLSTLALHQLRYGELDGPALTEARSHLDDCERCAARLRVQERERHAFVLRPMPAALKAPLPASAPWPRWLRTWLPLGLALGVATAAVFIALPTVPATNGPSSGNLTKGVLPEVEIWVDRGTGARPLRPQEALASGDRLQVKYDPGAADFVAFAGRDSRGLVEVYGSFPVTRRGLQEAPFGLVLDDAPGEQEIFVLTAGRPLDGPTVKAALQHGVPGVRKVRMSVAKLEHD